MKAYRSKVALVAGLGLIAGVSCGNGGTTSTTGGETTSSGTGGASTSSSATSTSGSGGGTTTATSGSSTSATTGVGSSTGTGGPLYGTCAPPCAVAADCCTPGDPACPSNKYPNNFTCVGGACQQPQCATTADCTAESPKLDCFALSGTNSCAFACAVDGDCNAPQTCSGKDDNGKKFCLAMGSGCKDDAFCKNLGIGKCVAGVCSCAADADCTKPGFSKCSK
jgi:hypothetical protein